MSDSILTPAQIKYRELKQDPVRYKRFIGHVVRNNKKFAGNRKAKRDAAAGPKPSHCPICLTQAADTGVRKLVWDHNHRTGRFRGWCCCQCNRALGLFSDDPETMRRAALYIQTDEARNPPLPWQQRA